MLAQELDPQSAEYQRAMAHRRRRAAVLAQLRAQHAKTTPPLPLWLSVALIVLLVWGCERFAERLWGLEDKLLPMREDHCATREKRFDERGEQNCFPRSGWTDD